MTHSTFSRPHPRPIEELSPVSSETGCLLARATTALVLVLTLFPYRFTSSAQAGTYYAGSWVVIDFVANVALFVPLGFGLAAYMTGRDVRQARIALKVLACGFGLSLGVEILQHLLDTRYPMLLDVLANASGSAVGLLAFRRWGAPLGTSLSRRALRVRRPSARLLLSLFAIYAVVGCLVPALLLRWATGLGNWDDSFPLVLGNELTGDRPWRGSLSRVVMTDWVLPEAVLETLRTTPEPTPRLSPLFAFYRQENNGRLPVRPAPVPELVWAGEHGSGGQSHGPVILTNRTWLQTREPPATLVRRLREARRFTLIVEGMTADPAQHGPARIVSLSRSPFQRNLTLAQDETSLVVRLRTPFTGENGTPPETRVSEVFTSAAQPRHVAVTYDGRSLSVIVDGVKHAPPTPLIAHPGAIVVSFVASRLSGNPWSGPSRRPSSWDRQTAVYYVALFLPLGLLLGGGLATRGPSPLATPLVLPLGMLLPPLALEMMVSQLSGHQTSPENVALGTGLTGLAAFVLWPTTAPPSPRGRSESPRESDGARPTRPG